MHLCVMDFDATIINKNGVASVKVMTGRPKMIRRLIFITVVPIFRYFMQLDATIN